MTVLERAPATEGPPRGRHAPWGETSEASYGGTSSRRPKGALAPWGETSKASYGGISCHT